LELLDVPIRLKDYKKPLHLSFFTDIHRSAVGCDAKKLRSDIERLRARAAAGEDHRWWGGGDWCNAIGPRDKRFDSSVLSKEFQAYEGDCLFQTEARVLAQEFDSIKHLGIAIGMGNHEKSIAKYNDYNPALDIAERLNLPFIGYSALMRLRLSAENCDHTCSVIVFWHHGRGSARTKGSKMTALYSFRDTVQADLYAAGHDHSLFDFPEVRLEGSRKGEFKLIKRDTLFLDGGTYLKSWPTDMKAQRAGEFNKERVVHSDYAEIAAFTPAVIGHGGVKINMDVHSARSGSGGFKLSRWECR
jgi:hypothetical protein